MKILIPSELRGAKVRGCNGYSKLKGTYSIFELKPTIKGKKVKHWKLVYNADDEEGDEYIPVYEKKK